MSNFTHHAFISYSHKNKDWVRNILQVELENRGFSIAIDYKDFVGGSFTINEVEKFIENSKHVIAVLSPDYCNSEWSTLENILTRVLDPAQKRRKLIPILYQETKLSLSLQAINYLDFRTPNKDSWRKLVESIM